MIYNLPENSKAKDKEMILQLMEEITGQDLSRVLKDLLRMGRKLDEMQHPRPILIKLENYIAKNLIMKIVLN